MALAHLALIVALVPLLQVLDPQHPVEGALLVQHGEARVRRVRADAVGQDRPVAAADPRNLREIKERERERVKFTNQNQNGFNAQMLLTSRPPPSLHTQKKYD